MPKHQFLKNSIRYLTIFKLFACKKQIKNHLEPAKSELQITYFK